MTQLRTSASPIALFAAALVAGSVGAFAPACGKDQGAEKMPPAAGPGAPPRAPLPAVEPAVTAETGAASAQRTTGTTYPLDRTEVSADMPGIIEAVAVEEGDLVKKGQILFQLRTTEIGLGVRQAQASLRSAKVALSAAKVEYDRMKRLLEQKATEQAQFDRVTAQYQAAQVGVEQAKVVVSQARRRLTDASVRSPIGGVVTEVRKQAGEMATLTPITVVLVVEDQSTLELRFRLPESALSRVKAGDTVTARFEAIGAERTAKVHRISPAIDLRTRTFEVIARMENADGALKSGMLAVVELGAAPAAKAIATPASAEASAAGRRGE